MIKITAIAPYQEFGDLFRDMFEKHEQYMHKTDYEANEESEYELEVIVATADNAINKVSVDSDVIVARGATATILRNKNCQIPIVEIPIPGHDIVRALYECKVKYGNKKIGAIGTVNMVMGVEDFSDILGLDIKSYIFTDHDGIIDTINLAVKEGVEIIMGGINTCIFAEKLGPKAILLKSGPEAILYAISEAKRVANISRREQEKALRFKTILDYAYEGVIAIDDSNIISVFNASAEKIFSVQAQAAIGRCVNDILPKSKFRDLINTYKEYIGEIVRHNNVQLAVNRVPIMLKGEKVGAVITFQDVTRIQEIEGKIREKIYTRGHVAKHTFDDIIGRSSKLNEAIQTAKRFSQVDSNILIVGETGTGKELFAQSIHNYSPRAQGPFVAVNCAALPENLLESELFGYVEGAFTGAAKGGKPGLFELAHRGTIFLDEISEISLKLQGRLLRVLQEKEIMRLGHDRVIPVDVRIIAATNKDLYTFSQKGEFREDLYYRLDILKINLPALKERKEDIPLIADSLVKKYGDQFKKTDMVVSESAKKMMREYNWSGNIRELSNICERLVVLSRSNIIDVDEVKAVLPNRMSVKLTVEEENVVSDATLSNNHYIQEMKEFEKDRIKDALAKVRYNKNKAAELLGVSRTTLWRKMKELNIR
ncbi:sigma 54-interacting transcriptional regulator [Petroclostridium sp. X23]|uniref:sigma 54-interacting transcriptional regulator n=1 Tax=Petroclostridium sp. X23 TaxID=3045146 RepID=UPI0024ACA15B|nr:sigma 54-interacting transcriptional regulator [Petroclostridium sp. X23]WHH57623.1 sigma 54-interacting transcriptional regulator [Petroclostridium sp. X23]